jgi:hypothetical protein
VSQLKIPLTKLLSVKPDRFAHVRIVNVGWDEVKRATIRNLLKSV